jgi:hypothetical protein
MLQGDDLHCYEIQEFMVSALEATGLGFDALGDEV